MRVVWDVQEEEDDWDVSYVQEDVRLVQDVFLLIERIKTFFITQKQWTSTNMMAESTYYY